MCSEEFHRYYWDSEKNFKNWGVLVLLGAVRVPQCYLYKHSFVPINRIVQMQSNKYMKWGRNPSVLSFLWMLCCPNLVPSKAIPSEGKTNCNDQPLQNILVLWVTLKDLEGSTSILLKIPLFYYKTLFFLDFLFMVVKQKGQVPAGISQLSSLHCCDRSKAYIWKIFRRNQTCKHKKNYPRGILCFNSIIPLVLFI